MTTAIFPGSFDPITLGHQDLIVRAARIFEQVVVAVAHNAHKKSLFSAAQRQALIQQVLAEEPKVKVVICDGLVSDLARAYPDPVLLKGIRDAQDLAWEQTQAAANRQLGQLETVFLPTSAPYSFLSSSLVKEIAHYHGKLEGMVAPLVAQVLTEKFRLRARP